MVTIDTTPDGRFETADLEVCQDCILFLANGACEGCLNCVAAKCGEDEPDPCVALVADIAYRWGDDVRHLVPGGDDLGYNTSACDGCGSTDHGDRFTAALLKPRR